MVVVNESADASLALICPRLLSIFLDSLFFCGCIGLPRWSVCPDLVARPSLDFVVLRAGLTRRFTNTKRQLRSVALVAVSFTLCFCPLWAVPYFLFPLWTLSFHLVIPSTIFCPSFCLWSFVNSSFSFSSHLSLDDAHVVCTFVLAVDCSRRIDTVVVRRPL